MNLVREASRIIREKGVRVFAKIVIRVLDDKTGLVSFLLLPYIIYRSRRLEFRELLEELFNDSSLLSILYRPMQVKWEIERLSYILRDLRPKYLLEIGTARGGTLFLWTRLARDDALIISIDLPKGSFGGGYPLLKGFAYKFFAKRKQKIVLIRGDSHDSRTLKKVKEILAGRKLDFLFIDGDHTYEGVKKDYEMYSSLVRKAGIIAFHDIVPHPSKTRCEVSKFWNEIKTRYNYTEIVKDQTQKWAGIGIIIV